MRLRRAAGSGLAFAEPVSVIAKSTSPPVPPHTRLVSWVRLTWFTVGVGTMLVVASLAGCGRVVPVDHTASRLAPAGGTISGTVRGRDSSAARDGRVVEVVNIADDQRHRTTTNSGGGFTIKVKPGKYRVELTLRDGEVLEKQPGVLNVDRSEDGARADFLIGGRRAARPRGGTKSDVGLGSPIA